MSSVDASNNGQAAASDIVAVGIDTTVHEAAKAMWKRKIGAILVTDDHGKLVGILSERDLLSHVAMGGVDLHAVLVKDIMTSQPTTCPEGTTMAEARTIMMSKRIRHLPVVDTQGKAVRMISSRDAMTHQVLSDRAMRGAAEQVAMLSVGLKDLSFDEVVDMLTHHVPDSFDAERSIVFFPGEEGSDHPMLVSRHRCPRRIDNDHRHTDVSPDGEVFCGDAPAECTHVGANSPCMVIPLEMPASQDNASQADEPSRGFLCMCGLDESLATMQDLVSYKGKLIQKLLTASLSSAKLYQRARDQSLTDSLTGAGSRRFFEESFNTEFTRAQRHGHPFCVAMLDVDHFKQINDTLGHAVGDEALRQITDAINEEKRGSDILSRYGGDEFVLLMPETGLDGATQLLERIRRQALCTQLPGDGQVTVSCGVAEYLPPAKLEPEQLLRWADQALYKAKEAGRNQVTAWREEWNDSPEAAQDRSADTQAETADSLS